LLTSSQVGSDRMTAERHNTRLALLSVHRTERTLLCDVPFELLLIIIEFTAAQQIRDQCRKRHADIEKEFTRLFANVHTTCWPVQRQVLSNMLGTIHDVICGTVHPPTSSAETRRNLICSARRIGISTVLTVLVAALLTTVPNLRVMYFTNSERADHDFVESVRVSLGNCSKANFRLFQERRWGEEFLSLEIDGCDDGRILHTIPRRVAWNSDFDPVNYFRNDTNSPCIVVMDNISSVSNALIDEIVLPNIKLFEAYVIGTGVFSHVPSYAGGSTPREGPKWTFENISVTS